MKNCANIVFLTHRFTAIFIYRFLSIICTGNEDFLYACLVLGWFYSLACCYSILGLHFTPVFLVSSYCLKFFPDNEHRLQISKRRV